MEKKNEKKGTSTDSTKKKKRRRKKTSTTERGNVKKDKKTNSKVNSKNKKTPKSTKQSETKKVVKKSSVAKNEKVTKEVKKETKVKVSTKKESIPINKLEKIKNDVNKEVKTSKKDLAVDIENKRMKLPTKKESIPGKKWALLKEETTDSVVSTKSTVKPSSRFLFVGKDETVVEKKYVPIEDREDVVVYDVSKKKYVDFESRVVLLLLLLISSFFIAGVFIYQAVTYRNISEVVYTEDSYVDYEVCSNSNNTYKGYCFNEGMKYSTDLTDVIAATFSYDAVYTDAISYNYNYYVVSKVSIYDRTNRDNVFYDNEEVLVERTSFDGIENDVDFAVNVDIPFKSYVTQVNDYNNKYVINGAGMLEVSLYLDDNYTARKIASLTIPLTDSTYKIERNLTYNENKTILKEDSEWDEQNMLYATFGTFFALLGLALLIWLFHLIYRTINLGTLYQRKLNHILKAYDKIIVISKGSYVIPTDSRVIRVTSFDELKDARDTLEKPIVYVKVNNVKSEFYVEDGNKIYLYVMKEADFEEK